MNSNSGGSAATQRISQTEEGTDKMTVCDFIDGEYMAHVNATLAKSTADGYRKLWAAYRGYFDGVELDMRTCDAQAILRKLCAENPHINKTTIRHAKNFFSGVWSHALRMGAVERDNPWRAVAIPQAPEPTVTHAYSPAEIETMLAAAPAPYDLVILLAACTGLRKSEIRGLQWGDWDNKTSTLSVNRAVWRSHVKTTKSKASKAPVPVVPLLAAKLDAFRNNAADSKPIFANSNGGLIDLDNAARRIIAPLVPQWHGWHAFRRGLATFLHSKGVPDMEIKEILRHENVSITQRSYVKVVDANVRAAMSNVRFGEAS